MYLETTSIYHVDRVAEAMLGIYARSSATRDPGSPLSSLCFPIEIQELWVQWSVWVYGPLFVPIFAIVLIQPVYNTNHHAPFSGMLMTGGK